ncbi:MAG: hypothetical protein AVDCRST_MAG59-2625, partial [uncultured Thermomicrobiales bacterium]
GHPEHPVRAARGQFPPGRRVGRRAVERRHDPRPGPAGDRPDADGGGRAV